MNEISRGNAAVALAALFAIHGSASALVVTWDGGGDGSSWEDPLNWSTNALPGPADDVTIALGTGVTLTRGVVSIASLNVSRDLTLAGGSLAVAGSFTISGGSTDFSVQGASVSGSPVQTDGTLALGAGIPAPVTVVVLGSSVILVELDSPLATVAVRGSVAFSTASLVVPDNFTIAAGTIRLESEAVHLSRIDGDGLVNGPNGVIDVVGPVGTRSIVGSSFVNEGTISVDPSITLTIGSSGTAEFRSGTLQNTANLSRSTGTTLITGGSFDGELNLFGGTIRVANSITEPVTVVARGSTCLLTEFNSPLATLAVRGSSGFGTGELNFPVSFTIPTGTIRLESEGAQLSRLDGDGLINGPNATIDVAGPTGTRSIVGASFVNEGTIAIERPMELVIQTSGTVEFRGGSVQNTTGLMRSGGTTLVSGGSFDDELRVTNTAIRIAESITEPTTVVALGSQCSLTELESALATVVVRGTNLMGFGELNFASNFTIPTGTIRLESEIDEIARLDGDGLINGPDATIEVAGPAGLRQVVGAGFVNDGTIVVEPGMTLSLNSSGIVEFRSGSVVNSIGVTRNTGTTLISGGSFDDELRLTNTTIRIASSIVEPLTVVVLGSLCNLIEFESPLATLVVRGTTNGGFGELNFPDGFTIPTGTIRLESEDAVTARLDGDDITNGPGATIEVAGQAGARQLQLSDFVNEGTILIDPSVTLAFNGSGVTEFRSGTVVIGGAATRATGATLITGGVCEGELQLSGSASLQIADSLTDPITVRVTDTTVSLQLNDSPLGTVRVFASTNLGTAEVNLSAGFVNRGTILLDSEGAQTARLDGSTVVTNGPAGVIAATRVPGATRSILDPLVNDGTLAPEGPLAISGAVTFGPTSVFIARFGGTAAGEFTQVTATGAATLDGVIALATDSAYEPRDGTEFQVLSGSSRSGSFIETVTCDDAVVSYTPTAAQVTFSAGSGVLGDLTGDGDVDGADLGLLLSLWGACDESCCPADLDGDKQVNGADLGLLLSSWG